MRPPNEVTTPARSHQQKMKKICRTRSALSDLHFTDYGDEQTIIIVRNDYHT